MTQRQAIAALKQAEAVLRDGTARKAEIAIELIQKVRAWLESQQARIRSRKR